MKLADCHGSWNKLPLELLLRKNYRSPDAGGQGKLMSGQVPRFAYASGVVTQLQAWCNYNKRLGNQDCTEYIFIFSTDTPLMLYIQNISNIGEGRINSGQVNVLTSGLLFSNFSSGP